MSANWDSYFCEVDGKPASILTDLGMVREAPMPEYPVLGFVSVIVKEPDDLGFPEQNEYEALGGLEDGLEAALCADEAAVYVGRCLSDGRLDMFYYLKDASGWAERVAQALGNAGGYAWESGSHEDPDWRSYSDFLFPDEPDMLHIQNVRVLRELFRLGDDVSKSRVVEHWADFPDSGAAAAFGDGVRLLGFTVESVDQAEEGWELADPRPLLTQVRLSRPDAPESISDITTSLAALAREHGGAYRGWACTVVEEEPSPAAS